MGGWMDGWMDGWVGGWMGGWIDVVMEMVGVMNPTKSTMGLSELLRNSEDS
jgi:hypothetical protein